MESPQFFGNFSAHDTLSLLADAGGVDQRRVFEVLELVGLRDRAKDRVKTYSLGMKQRLAVASATQAARAPSSRRRTLAAKSCTRP